MLESNYWPDLCMSDRSFFFEIVQLRCGIFNGCDEFLLWQVYVKFSALFRVSRIPFPYEDLAPLLAQLVSSYGANRIMWGRWLIFSLSSMKKDAKRGEMKNWNEKKEQLMNFLFCLYCYSDFPFVVPESGYKGAKESVSLIANEILSSSELEWIMGRTVMELFKGQWLPS